MAISQAFDARRLEAKLGHLVDETEELMECEAVTIPAELRSAIRNTLRGVYGRTPPWIDDVVSPAAMLSHLFVAEGRLRQSC